MVDAIPSADASPLFTDQEKATLAFAVELTRTAAVGDATFERTRKHFDERQLVELVLTIGVANLNNRVTEAFWADIEP